MGPIPHDDSMTTGHPSRGWAVPWCPVHLSALRCPAQPCWLWRWNIQLLNTAISNTLSWSGRVNWLSGPRDLSLENLHGSSIEFTAGESCARLLVPTPEDACQPQACFALPLQSPRTVRKDTAQRLNIKQTTFALMIHSALIRHHSMHFI